MSPPLVVFGLDAGTPALIHRWVAEGYLPSIGALMRRGWWGETCGADLVTEHGVWFSLFSGMSRTQHGYYFQRQLIPGTYDLRLTSGLDLPVRPFWGALRGSKKRVLVVDAPDCSPVPGVPGLQVTNWASHLGGTTRGPASEPHAEPAGLLADVRGLVGDRLGILEDVNASPADNRRIYAQLLEQIRRKGVLCRGLLAQQPDPPDLTVVVFAESHTGGHQFWPLRAEAGTVPTSEFAYAIRDVYQAIDREIGTTLACLPADAHVFVVSSVGVQESYPTTGLAESFFRQLGYQAAPRASSRPSSPLALARRVLPESWRVGLSRHLPRETRERLVADQFRSGTDWARTRAFSIPGFYGTFVRVNLRGREPQGTVDPSAAYEALLDEIERDLRQLTIADSGAPAVRAVHRTMATFGLAEPPSVLPDLFVDWANDRFLQDVRHPRARLTQRRPEFYRESDHERSGFVAYAGPWTGPSGERAAVEVLDLAPTFLHLLGAPAPADLVGRPLAGFAHA